MLKNKLVENQLVEFEASSVGKLSTNKLFADAIHRK